MSIIERTYPLFSIPIVKIKTLTQDYLKGHYTLLFFYAVYFSPICRGEVYALQENIEEFNKRNVTIIGISVDSIYTHLACLR